MVFPVVGGTQDTGYEISNSLRFNDSQYLEKTFSSAGNRRTFTISFWTKRCVLGNVDEEHIFSADSDTFIRFEGTNDRFRFASNTSPNVNPIIETNRQFRDVSAWYHIVLRVDTTQASASNRVRLYVNGSEETSFATDSRSSVSQNADIDFTNNTQHTVGTRSSSVSDSPYTSYLADFYMIDGQSLAPTEFGETNTNGVWIPKDYLGTYGTNGFLLEFQQTGTSANSSGMGADTSGNDHHFTPQSLTATDVTTDTPTNNFATWNPLDAASNISGRFSEGNMDVDVPGNNVVSGAEANGCLSTIQFSKGKWYFEMKYEYGANGFQDTAGIGLIRTDTGFSIRGSTDTRNFSDNVFYYVDGPKTIDGTHTSYGDAWTQNDIIGVAANLDDDEVYFYKNGTIQNSGTAISKTFGDGFYSIANFHGSANGGALFRLNTGNPSFSISSGNSDANGYGNFEYAVPSGYYALCTKNLAEYG